VIYLITPVVVITTSLDNQTEQEIMQQIEQLKSNQTIFIIAHRITTLKQCDIIMKINADYTIEQVNFNQIAFNRN
jgi:ATP-binding cassette, subfamily B, bacterial PglK